MKAKPIRKPFFTPGTLILLGFMAVGFAFGLARFFTGLGAITNLDNHYPWGIWKAINVAVGVALAASGFTAAAWVDIFGRKKYHSLLRPAILTAWLGYIMVGVALVFDLGRYWNIWRPMFNWQGNSVLFEVSMCVMAYLVVLTFEMSPALLEGIKSRMKQGGTIARLLLRLEKPITTIHYWIKVVLPIFIIAGFVLSCMHHSSLGTLMMIAPTKLSPLWFTPMLPVLFLLSAMMVGFPLIIMEAILAGRAFKYKVNMDVLDSFAAKVPWLLGVYLVLKIGDLLFRWDQLDFFVHPNLTLSLALEIVAGVVIPFIMLLFRSVRRSQGLLLFSVMLVIGGVIINRLNTYVVGYYSSYAETSYFPSFGEMALTLALICTIIFFYRLVVTFFPVLPAATGEDDDESEYLIPVKQRPPLRFWAVRAVGVLLVLGFVFLYALVHREALAGEQLPIPELQPKKSERISPEAATAFKHESRPLAYANLYIMENPMLNGRTDYYEPVRFSHRTHDVEVGSDCSFCHHRVSDDPSDRVGEDLKEMHESIEARIGGACTHCHEDLKEKEFQKCSACHVNSNETDFPSRIGLKGAYHRQCIGCHQRTATAEAPTDCQSCHHPLTPDHRPLVEIPDGATARQVTARCLECHKSAGDDILDSAHWNWKGRTPAIAGHEHSIDTGLLQVMDNYTITMRPELVPTWAFHIGYATKDGRFAVDDPNSVDCLVCHDTTRMYRKDEQRGGLPLEEVDPAQMAGTVGRPSRANCGSCHFYVGGGPNVKHGDLEPSLVNPSPEDDVHMGMVNMRCQACHQTRNHRIPGMSFMAPVTEGRVTCEKCHGSRPHGITGYLSRHLDDHIKALSCEACHIPHFAKTTPTLLATDFSTAGQDKTVETDTNGMPLYDKKRGDLTWGKKVAPTYRWFDGNRKSYLSGDKLYISETVELNAPLGEKHIPESRIFPFKVHTAKQPYDSENEILAAVRFKDGFWKNFDWDKAIAAGMKAVGLEYSGKYDFVETKMYTSLHHGVVPAKQALGCADCHSVQAITCTRCHKKAAGMEQPEHTRKLYPDVENRMDFKALGYEDDPAIIGGRFYMKLGRGKPPK